MRIRRLLIGGSIAIGLWAGISRGFAHEDDSPTARYYEQLRLRGLYQLAESHAESRLADPLLAPERRIEFVIELSRTLVAHALSAADDQQPELWNKASAVLAEEISVAGDSPRKILLETYAALVPSERVEQMVWDLEAAPFDEPVRESLDRISQQALAMIRQAGQSLLDRIRALDGKKKAVPGITVHELRRLASHLRLKEGFVMQARARLSPAGSQQRHSDLIDADEQFNKHIKVTSDESKSAANLGLAVSNRLRDELDLAMDVLEREQKSAGGELLDAILLERVRVLLMAKRGEEAAHALIQIRNGRNRMAGEYWMTYVQMLALLRRTATERKSQKMLVELNDRALAALKDVDEQAGGSWSRRCRTIWSSAESVERYGPRVTALISRGKSEYLAGRMEAAVTAYSSALELAQEDGKTDLEMDVGYTLAAILAKEKRWDDVAQRCRQLVAAHAEHPKAPEIDLLHLHALGLRYDQQKDSERKSAYERGLAEHLERFPQSATLSEVEFLRGQFWETSGQIAEALTAYELVKADHARGPAATAAVARCRVARLLQQREIEARDSLLEQTSINFLAAQFPQLPEQPAAWSDAQTELAYHGVRVLLLIEPPRCAEAERWLLRLEEATHGETPTGDRSEVRLEIGRRTGPLRLIALAGQGRPQEAERLLGTLEQSSPMELLAVVEELSQIEIPSPAAAQRSLIEMQLATAERLKRRKSELTDSQQRRLDFALAKSYLATAQPAKAVAIYQGLFDANPRDVELARQLGQMLLPREERACRKLAKSCWQRVESSFKQGSPAWLDARGWVIESCLRAGDHAEARKLLKVTKLIYANTWDESMQQRYAKLESQLK